MSSSLVSVIIPVYNAERYLKECIISVINQTYKNLEVICIDDGSFDNSCAILDEFAKKDDRITVIHQKNGGVSSARNQGLKVFRGEYVAFLDSDDYLHCDYVEQLVNRAEKYNAEIVRCNAETDGVTLETVKKDFYLKADGDYLYNEQTFSPYVHHALYKRSLITEDGFVTFDESFGLGEDCYFNAVLTMKAQSFYYLAKTLYYKRDAVDSITKTANIKVYKSFIQSKIALIDYVKGLTMGKAYRLVLDRYLFALCDVCKKLKTVKTAESKEYLKHLKKSIRKNYKNVLSAGFGKKQKLKLIISGIL